jgi:hypothetical protein
MKDTERPPSDYQRSEDGRHFYTGLQYLEPTAEFLQVVQRIISELE